MRHEMKLRSQPFNMIRSGQKTYELRLYYVKRQRVQVNDEISDDTRADAIMDRVFKNSYHLDIDGPSFRGMEARKRMEAAKVIDESSAN